MLGLFGHSTDRLKYSKSDENEGLRRASISGLAPASAAGTWRVSLAGFKRYEVLITESAEVGDMGTGKDAPNTGDEGATEVQLSTVGVGYAMSETDEVDRYKVVLPAVGEYQVRLRPDSATVSRVVLYDDEGNRLGSKESNNAGAGVTLDMKAEGRRVVYVQTEHNTGGALGSYAMIVGPAGLDAPEPPKRKNPPEVVFE